MVIPTKQLPGISPLVIDYYYSYEKVDEFYNGNFRDLSSFQHQAEKVEARNLQRGKLTAILKEQNQDYGCGNQTLDNIDRLTQNQAYAVVTGQQAGLFSGPLYTIYKSLTAIKLAEHLNQNCQGCFVPIFWMASDDHDFTEINHIKLLDKNNRIEEIYCQSQASKNKIPASKILLAPEIFNCIRLLKDLTHDSEFKQDIILHLTEAYQPGRSFVEAFARWMTQMFKSYGLIFIDASHPGLKELGKKVFHQEITGNSPSTKRAIKTSNKLSKANYPLQINVREEILNMFFAEQERQTIQSKDESFSIKGRQHAYKSEELLAVLEEKPELFSPNVLLRPIYQDTLLPTVAYIGGPAEIAYFAQMKGIYESFGLPMPVIYPRKTITVLEKKVDKVLKSYNLKIQDIWRSIDKVINEITKKQIPESIDKSLNVVTSHLEEDFESLKKEMATFEPTLEDSVDAALGKINQRIKFLEKKVMQASKKRNDIVTQQLHKAKNNLYPSNRLQERVLNIGQFLIKYSYAFIDRLYKAIDINCYDHQVIKL